MATKILKINNFNQGMTDDVRDSSKHSLIKNFEIGSTLKPNVSLNKNTGSYSINYAIKKVVYAGVTDAIYGLGVNYPTNTYGLIYKLSSPLDATNSTWASTGQALSTTTNYKLWSIYKDYIYYGLDNNKIGRFGNMAGSPVVNNTWKTFSTDKEITTDGFIGKDDNLYVATKQTNKQRLWFGVETSSDGTKVAGVVQQWTSPGYIYTSTDSALTFTERVYDQEWSCITGSSDGTILYAGTLNGKVWKSTDSGATWSELANSPDDGHSHIACSDNGTIVYTTSYGHIWYSGDSGATWTDRKSSNYSGVACTSAGTTVYITNATTIVKSTDSGATWGTPITLTLGGGSVVSCDTDGSVVACCGSNGPINVSTDSGANFTQRDSTRYWMSIVVSKTDGSKMYAGVNNGYIYVSSDTGTNWTAKQTDENRTYYGIDCSSDGTKVYTVDGPGFFYRSTDSGANWVSVTTNALTPSVNRIDGTNLTEDVIELPANLTITQMCNYGNYMAIICKPDYADANSKLYLWDYILDDVTEAIDLGEGEAQAGENLNGSIIVFVKHTGDSTIPREDYIRVIAYQGGTTVSTLFTLKGKPYSTSSIINLTTPAYDYSGQLYVGGYASSNEVQYEPMIIRVGRKNINEPLSYDIQHYFTTGTNTGIYDFLFLEGNALVSTQGATSAVDMYITYDANTFTTTSYWDTSIIDGDDATLNKQLCGVSVQYAPLPTAGQVVLKYRKDGETSWTTIFTDTTDGAISHESVNIESTGANLPQFREIEFRIESTGGAKITGLKVLYEELNGLLE